jgi:dihydroorotate dehydrogenase electron transfer subunit
VRLSIATITANTVLRPGVHLIEVKAPQLAQAVQPGQFCMVRCCHPQALDPLLRRPFFIHSVERSQGLCTLLVTVRGRGSAWLAQQQAGMQLDLFGPLGRGWQLHATVRNLLLIGEEAQMAALPMLAEAALRQEMAVTLLSLSSSAEEAYPPALLPEEVEYHIVTGDLLAEAREYLTWADAVCCSVSRETLTALYWRYERMRKHHFAQGVLLQPLVCGSGVCLTCSVETRTGQQLICRDGPVFAARKIIW